MDISTYLSEIGKRGGSVTGTKKGFAAASPEKLREAMAKSLATRLKKKAQRERAARKRAAK